MPKEINSIDSATVVIGKDTGKDNVRQVDTELMEIDKAFIKDAVSKGMGPETTYAALTEHRLSKGKPRILKRAVDEEHKQALLLDETFVKCPVSGLKANTVARFRLESKKDKKDAVINLCVPVHKSVLEDYEASFKSFDISELDTKNYTFVEGLPILKDVSFVGDRK